MSDIKARQEILDKAAVNLKNHFFGIDNVIDNVIDNISAWYLFSELATRPQIVCLWGLTGVGKTDLIRKLCKELNINQNFCEIQLDGNTQVQRSIADILTHTNINQEEHSVLLLDEIQRFKTIDEDGCDITDVGMQDIWMILSDGTLGSKNSLKSDLMSFLMEMHSDIYYKEKKEIDNKNKKISDDDDDDEDMVVDDNHFSWGRRYNANRLYRFDSSTSVEEYAKMNTYEQRDKVVELLSDTNTFVPKPYSKMLIFISGNLDEAFHVATSTDQVEIDADLIYEETKKINVLDIKNSLKRRFKPEQIARFGNNYIIYPSLNREAYEKIIKKRISDFTKKANKLLKTYKLKINLDDSIHKMLYNNGVYPAQGVRPILSTIDSFINNVIPKVVIKCEGNTEGTIFLEVKDKDYINFICTPKKSKKSKKLKAVEGSVKFIGEIDEIKEKERSKIKQLASTAVHEAGHVAVHCALFKLTPKMAKIGCADTTANGFIYNAIHPTSFQEMEDFVQICYAGMVAEEMVFGKENIGSGASADFTVATETLSRMIRHLGMSEKSKFNVAMNNDLRVTDTKDSNKWIKDKSKELFDKTKNLLKENEDFFKHIIKSLSAKKELSPLEIQEIASQYGLEVDIKEDEDVHFDYLDKYLQYIEGGIYSPELPEVVEG
jgi:hypothetical protein